MSHLRSALPVATAFAFVVVVTGACRRENDAPPTQTVYQNGYPQTQQQAYGNQVTYQNGYPQQGYPQQGQGYPQQGYPPQQATPTATMTAAPAPTAAQPAPTAATPAAPPTGTMIGVTPPPAPQAPPATMAVPGPGAIPCQSDAACILGRCNVPYGRCAYPCKSSAVDCAPNAVCGPLGLCVPNVQFQSKPQ